MCFRPSEVDMTKKCRECGADNAFANEVCDNCGAKLQTAPKIGAMPGVGAPGEPSGGAQAPAAPKAPGAPQPPAPPRQ